MCVCVCMCKMKHSRKQAKPGLLVVVGVHRCIHAKLKWSFDETLCVHTVIDSQQIHYQYYADSTHYRKHAGKAWNCSTGVELLSGYEGKNAYVMVACMRYADTGLCITSLVPRPACVFGIFLTRMMCRVEEW